MRVLVFITAVASLFSMFAFVPLFQACNSATKTEVVTNIDAAAADATEVEIKDATILEVVKTEDLHSSQGVEVEYIDISVEDSKAIMDAGNGDHND